MKLLKIISYYSQLDQNIPISACTCLVNFITYSIKICPEIELRLGALIKTEIDMKLYQISIIMINYVNFNLRIIQESIASNKVISKDDELCFRNMSRVSLLI